MKKLLQIFLTLLISTQVFAQTFTPPAYADIDTNYRTYVNQVFGLLETARVSTGLLVDYGFDFTNPKIYNGTVLVDSTLMEQGLYADLYKTLYTSRRFRCCWYGKAYQQLLSTGLKRTPATKRQVL